MYGPTQVILVDKIWNQSLILFQSIYCAFQNIFENLNLLCNYISQEFTIMIMYRISLGFCDFVNLNEI